MSFEKDTLREEVRAALLADWDPSNAARFAGDPSHPARGEYDRYIDPLLELIAADSGEEAIVDYLYEREREILCFPGLGKQRLRRVGRRLLALKMRANP